MPDAPKPTSPTAYEATTAARSRARRTPAWLRRVRYSFSRESLREFATTLALVVPLTVLIWVWAEREQTKEYKPIIQVNVHALNPSRVMSVVNDNGRNEPVNVSVTLVGPKSGIDALSDALNRDPSHARVTLEVPDDIEPAGTHDVNIQPLLDDQKLFRDFGVTVRSVEPGTIKVHSDAVVTRDLKVTYTDDFFGQVASIVAEPATVRVRGPENDITQLQAQGLLRADVDLSLLRGQRNIEPGSQTTLTDVPLRPIDRANVTLEPTIVSRVTVRFSDAEQGELRSVVVNVSQPGNLDARVVEIDPPTINVIKIAGPPDALRRLQQSAEPEQRPYAQIRIGRNDIGRTVTLVPQILNLPQGVSVIDPAGVQSVRVRVVGSGDGSVVP